MRTPRPSRVPPDRCRHLHAADDGQPAEALPWLLSGLSHESDAGISRHRAAACRLRCRVYRPGAVEIWGSAPHEGAIRATKTWRSYRLRLPAMRRHEGILLSNQGEATKLYREGATFICPGCNDKMKVVSKITPGVPGSDGEVRFVNENGHECLTVARALPKK